MSFVTVKKIKFSKSLQPFAVGADILLAFFFGSQIFKSSVPGNKVIWAVFFAVTLFLLTKNVRKMLMLKNLFKIDAILASSEKKEIHVFTISENLGMSEKRMTHLLKKLIKKNYLHSCVLDTETEPKIVLKIQNEENRTELSLECPSCGNVFTAEAGAVIRCPECASIINI